MAAASTCVRRLPLVVILGCTGTGKSKLAIEIGKKIGGEIISADSMQVYSGLPIITNQVTKEELQQCPHHVINFVSPFKEFSVVQFRNLALPLIDDIKKRGKIPIIVGGTNYYIESLLWDILIDAENEKESETLSSGEENESFSIKRRKVIECNGGLESTGSIPGEEKPSLHTKLATIDPEMASRLHPNDTRKIARSLQVYEHHGIPHSQLLVDQRTKEGGTAFGGPLRFDFTCVFWLQCEKEVLNDRLDKRVDKMIENGLVKELLDFHQAYNKERIDNVGAKYTEGIFQSIGFKEFHEFLLKPNLNEIENIDMLVNEHKEIFENCVDSMKTITRRYAKKQTQWVKNRFLSRPKGAAPDVYGLDATDLELWNQSVLERAILILDAIINDEIPNVKPLERNITDPNGAHTKHVCGVCDDRVIIGDKTWEKHLASKSHKWHVKKIRKMENSS
ncbi:tRNA dimethylallyltransferase-like [Actinia tenebrosa]|uniref:tRNA dimethylallyltransferase n=1 Tax=Actinia tenebrosa TaxID=6105 RepID=A0A6P8HA99_ACTTE|nr:tRNA dimethylallyltransferase-like [Actinia tenebrosa]